MIRLDRLAVAWLVGIALAHWLWQQHIISCNTPRWIWPAGAGIAALIGVTAGRLPALRLAAGLAVWEHIPPLALGYVLGGYAGGRVMNHLPQHWLRAGVVGFGLVMSGYFFWRAYL